MDNTKIFAKKRKLVYPIQTIKLYSQDLGMKFGREKCAQRMS